jgi:hypothetical protein
MMTLSFDDVPPAAFARLIETVTCHGVKILQHYTFNPTVVTDEIGLFHSVAGEGTFAYDGKNLTVTITRNDGHFSNLMIKGGLKQLVSEAREVSEIAGA